jgi:hypothetical protein
VDERADRAHDIVAAIGRDTSPNQQLFQAAR